MSALVCASTREMASARPPTRAKGRRHQVMASDIVINSGGSVSVSRAAAPSPEIGRWVTHIVLAASDPGSFEHAVTRAMAADSGGGNQGNAIPLAPSTRAIISPAAKTQKAFEAVALQVFISSMLPNDHSGKFSTGSAGNIWKSLLAEKMADKIASTGNLRLVSPAAFSRGMARNTAIPVAPTSHSPRLADITGTTTQAWQAVVVPSEGVSAEGGQSLDTKSIPNGD
jgi:peptidoglycan hydrolase FlgJ